MLIVVAQPNTTKYDCYTVGSETAGSSAPTEHNVSSTSLDRGLRNGHYHPNRSRRNQVLLATPVTTDPILTRDVHPSWLGGMAKQTGSVLLPHTGVLHENGGLADAGKIPL